MRRKTALCLLVVFMATVLFPVQALAGYDRELEKAITTAKALFKISAGYDNFTYNINKRKDNTVYDLMWNDSKNRLGNVSVSIDSNGKVQNYYTYKPYDGKYQQKKLPSVSKSDARKNADQFIRKVHPDLWNKLEYQENNYPRNINDRSYQFRYIRKENGIPFPENAVNIAVDAMNGDIQNFNYTWHEGVTFPADEGVIGLAEAQQKFAGKLGLKLLYKLNLEPNDQKPYAVYSIVYNNRFLDAKTGDVVTTENYYFGYDYGYGGSKEKMMDQGGQNNYTATKQEVLSPKEQDAVKNAADIMSQEKAEDIARKAFSIGADFKLSYVNLYNYWRSKDDYNWNLDFGKEEKSGGSTQFYNIAVTIDARTGDILNFYRSVPYEKDSRIAYSGEQALNIATDFIKAIQPVKYQEVERTTWREPVVKPMEEQREALFTFARKTKDIYFMEDGFTISVDRVTGTVTGYIFNWYKKDLPAVDKIISPDAAHKVLFEKAGLQLQYISRYPVDTRTTIMPPDPKIKPEIKLVYALKPEKPANVDAFTGKLLKHDGNPFEEGGTALYTDIKGIFAESQIKVLAEYGITLPGSQLKPNQQITQREFLYLLQKAINPYVEITFSTDAKDDEALYNLLIGAGIVKEGEKAPQSIVSRQEAVKFLIRALTYDKVAEIKGIYALPFKDAGNIKPDLYGYMAIAYGLKIIQGDNGYAKPAASLTKAQSYVLLYNFLNVQ